MLESKGRRERERYDRASGKVKNIEITDRAAAEGGGAVYGTQEEEARASALFREDHNHISSAGATH